MAAFDGNTQRPKGFIHDWLPLIVVAVLCVLVVALDVRL
jgi:hypothetical protein